MSMLLVDPAPPTHAAVEDRRREPRYSTPSWPVFLSAAISALGTEAKAIGHVRDISRGGLRVSALQMIAVGRPVGLCVALPGPLARQRDNFLKVTARPVWVGADGPDGFEIGYEFIAPAKATLRRIDTLVATLVETD